MRVSCNLWRELEFQAAVTSDFHIGGTYSHQHAALKDTVVVLNTDVGPRTHGIRPSEAPNWTSSLNASYDFHMPGGSTLTWQPMARAQ